MFRLVKKEEILQKSGTNGALHDKGNEFTFPALVLVLV